MCGNSTCTDNETYICCPLCKENYKIKSGYIVKSIINGDTKEQITMRICSECYKKYFSINKGISIRIDGIGGKND